MLTRNFSLLNEPRETFVTLVYLLHQPRRRLFYENIFVRNALLKPPHLHTTWQRPELRPLYSYKFTRVNWKPFYCNWKIFLSFQFHEKVATKNIFFLTRCNLHVKFPIICQFALPPWRCNFFRNWHTTETYLVICQIYLLLIRRRLISINNANKPRLPYVSREHKLADNCSRQMKKWLVRLRSWRISRKLYILWKFIYVIFFIKVLNKIFYWQKYLLHKYTVVSTVTFKIFLQAVSVYLVM